jgi:hypothetical protein
MMSRNSYLRRLLVPAALMMECSCDGSVRPQPTRVADSEAAPPSDAAGHDSTSESSHDTGVPDHVSPVDSFRVDSGLGHHDGSVGADARPVDSGTPLPDACVGLLACCTFIPQVDSRMCSGVADQASADDCSTVMSEYVDDGYLDGGPCSGAGSGTPACESLEQCCQFSAPPNCQQIVDAGNQAACESEYNMLLQSFGNCPSG